MRSGHFYTKLSNGKVNVQQLRFLRNTIFAALLLFFNSFKSSANVAPLFVGGPLQSITACGTITTSINIHLGVTDADGDGLTWDVVAGPSMGTLGGMPVTMPGIAGINYPTGVSYTPMAGFTGTETFTIGVSDGNGGFATTAITVTVNPGPTISLGTMPSICRGASTATIPFTALSAIGSDTISYSFTGFNQTWTVPAAVTSIHFDAIGASGGHDNYSIAPNPGKGGRVEGNLPVSPGTVLNIMVGGAGGNGTSSGGAAGFNGGGFASFYVFGAGGGGGGASDIRLGGTALTDRVVVAGGGGGNGADGATAFAGGDGGGLIGQSSATNLGGSQAGGGTQVAGGIGATYGSTWAPGSNGSLGLGGASSVNGVSGGGGGGYYGGGGGIWSGGGGGSSYTHPSATSITHTQGYHTGDGAITISYEIPSTYSIVWDAAALAEGFANVTNAPLPSSALTINIPAGANPSFPGVYNGTLTVSNGVCVSADYPITVQIKEVPDVIVPSDTTICNGELIPDIIFTSDTVTGSPITYHWENDKPEIGIGPVGIGKIDAFTPANPTPLPLIASITVTPISNGCVGNPKTFTITNNPIPALSSTVAPPTVCDSALFMYSPTSATPTTTFVWNRDAVTGISNAASAGSNNITEALNNTTVSPVAVTYVYTLSANGCNSTANVVATVNPTPVLTSTLTPPAVCDDVVFNYTPTTATSGATSAWSRATVAGIANAAATGSGAISESLDNTTSAPVVVTYVNTLTIDGCSNSQNVSVTVNPKPVLSSVTSATTCDSALFNYVQASTTPGTVFSWKRAVVSGISNPTANGTGDINEYLVNNTPFPIVVTYMDTLKANGCVNVQPIPVTVNPRPKLTSTLSPAGICTNTMFNYFPTSMTPGVAYVWGRDTVQGISNVAVLDSHSVHEVLDNYTDTAITVPYLYSLFANGCANTQTVRVTVYPKPKLNNPVHSFAVCDSTFFRFAPTSITPGSIFAWTRPYVEGLAQVAAGGTDDPNEQLTNNTNVDITTKYYYTITAMGCSNVDSIDVTVRPTPKLSSNLTPTVCSGVPFNYDPQSFTPLTTFSWSRANVTGIIPSTGSGTEDILETLTSSLSTSVTATYVVTLNYKGCVNKQAVNVRVNPGPGVAPINVATASAVCSNLQFANFGTTTPPPAGVTYSWSASGASIWASGSNKQYILVNFNTPGNAVITLTATSGSTACISTTTYNVNVGTGGANAPQVIYYNGQFVAQQTEVDHYQWGYDDAVTLDSTLIVGETNQNYANNAPDFANKYYWVITTRNGCTQKSYYRLPAGVTDMNKTAPEMKLYPNPAENYVNVALSNDVEGSISVEVFNMLGQRLSTVPADNNKAQVDVSNLPAGCYVVDCVKDGVKIASARFIKN